MPPAGCGWCVQTVPKIIGHGFVPRTERRDAVYLSPKLSSHIHAFVWLCFGTNSASPRGDVRVSGRANTPSWEYRIRLTGRLRNTASCLTAAPLSHSVTHSHMRWVGAYRHRRGHGRVRAHVRRARVTRTAAPCKTKRRITHQVADPLFKFRNKAQLAASIAKWP
jgi:hypothetical protein